MKHKYESKSAPNSNICITHYLTQVQGQFSSCLWTLSINPAKLFWLTLKLLLIVHPLCSEQCDKWAVYISAVKSGVMVLCSQRPESFRRLSSWWLMVTTSVGREVMITTFIIMVTKCACREIIWEILTVLTLVQSPEKSNEKFYFYRSDSGRAKIESCGKITAYSTNLPNIEDFLFVLQFVKR